MTLSEARMIWLGSCVKTAEGRTGLISGYMRDHDQTLGVRFYNRPPERIHYTSLTLVPTFKAPIPSELPTTPTPRTPTPAAKGEKRKGRVREGKGKREK